MNTEHKINRDALVSALTRSLSSLISSWDSLSEAERIVDPSREFEISQADLDMYASAVDTPEECRKAAENFADEIILEATKSDKKGADADEV